MFAGRKEIEGGGGRFGYCGVRGVIFRRFEPEIDLVSGSPWPLGCPSEGRSSGAGSIDPLGNLSPVG